MFGLGKASDQKVVERYIALLNARDREGIAGLLHRDCRFVDSHGEGLDGYDTVVRATERFFKLEPRFVLTVNDSTRHRGEVLLRGMTSAWNPALRTDILWRARVDQGKLAFWQSYGPTSTAPFLARMLGDAGGPSFAVTPSLPI